MTVTQEFMKEALRGKAPAKFLAKLKKERNKIIFHNAAVVALNKYWGIKS